MADASLAAWIVGAGGLAKIVYDGIKAYSDKMSAKASAAKTTAEALKTEAEAEGHLADVLTKALSGANGTAAEWMERYSEILKEVGALTAKVGGLESELAALRGEVKGLSAQRDGMESNWKRCQTENKELQRKLADEQRARAAVEEMAQQYKAGFDAAMLLMEGATTGKVDGTMMQVAEKTMRRVAEYESSRATAVASGGKREVKR